MMPLADEDLRALHDARRRLERIDPSQSDLDALRADWAPRIQPGQHDTSEDFDLARPDGTVTGASGPRWLFHLFGLCHRASHVGLATANGLIVLQRRSPTKVDWPGAWDMAVAGHVPAGLSFEEGARKEIEEEIGLRPGALPGLLVEGGLVPVGAPYYSYDRDEGRNPPFHNAESRQLFAGTLKPEGLACLEPGPEEVAGIYLCPPEEAWDILAGGSIASGLRYSLPRYLSWLMVYG